jgi:hypothetical protein
MLAAQSSASLQHRYDRGLARMADYAWLADKAHEQQKALQLPPLPAATPGTQ